ncbi:class I SAM-dependent methyltransferase [Desertibaculum subflavum]|uniref:class I SAM-dependent methyltransferase n=1 Tax=Desertibaculum subflavum TaxID=2268458 RepID=UPI000E65FE16
MSAVGSCWLCGSTDLALAWRGDLPPTLGPGAFRITDAAYGRTADVYDCRACGFRQARGVDRVLALYEAMDDPDYEATRAPRRLQAERLLKVLRRHRRDGRLLDIGAGSGILVEAARAMGFDAEGIEPSRALQAEAVARGLPVHRGVLPHPGAAGRYDAATVVDVIEHVPDPVGLMRDVREVLAPGGLCLVVTPDLGSLAARLLGRRWWHYRIAHIGYFDRATLARALLAAGFEVIWAGRPTWQLPAGYLARRALTYLPGGTRVPVPGWLDRVALPLNLFDSLLFLARRRA